MASLSLQSSSLSSTSRSKHHKQQLPLSRINSFSSQHNHVSKKLESLLAFRTPLHPGRPKIAVAGASSLEIIGIIEKDESLSSLSGEKPVKFLFRVVLWALVSLGFHALCGDARAAAAAVGADTIRGSGFGLKVANALRASGWPGEAVVFALATLPVIELRGAIPVGYWLQLDPIFLTLLSVLGLVSNIFIFIFIF